MKKVMSEVTMQSLLSCNQKCGREKGKWTGAPGKRRGEVKATAKGARKADPPFNEDIFLLE